MSHWAPHPHVRTGDQLSFGERAADRLKAAFGSWTFLAVLNAVIIGWVVLNIALPHDDQWDIYPFILLNLGLSWLAAQQGGALQIAANRGDRISSEVALGTHAMTRDLLALAAQILEINRNQMEILNELRQLREAVAPGNTESEGT